MMARLRSIAALLGLVCVLTACAPVSDQDNGGASMPETPQARLAEIVAGGGEPQRASPGASISVVQDGVVIWSAAAGTARFEADGLTPSRPLAPNDPVRAASISKLATAMVAQSLTEEGVVDLDAPISPLLGFAVPVRNGDRVTIRSALAHTSGICDPEIYWAPLGTTLEGLVTDATVCEHGPGEGWVYANINYALVAQVLEAATDRRFDDLARSHVLNPLGLEAGFNGAGMSAERRESGATLYRFIEGVWVAQIDDGESLAGPSPFILREPGARLTDYVPGTNGTLFSPQGGLRAGAEDLAFLASHLLPGERFAALGETVWQGEAEPGVRAWGSGPQRLVQGQVPGRPGLELVGHGGEAYGLYGGAWAVPACRAAIAFYVTGTNPEDPATRDLQSGLTWWEDQLLDLALDQLATLSGCDAAADSR